jgi:hypothetical protein
MKYILSEGWRSLETPRHRQKYDIKIDPRKQNVMRWTELFCQWARFCDTHKYASETSKLIKQKGFL